MLCAFVCIGVCARAYVCKSLRARAKIVGLFWHTIGLFGHKNKCNKSLSASLCAHEPKENYVSKET